MSLSAINSTGGTANFFMRTPGGTVSVNYNCLISNFQASNSVAMIDTTTFCDAGTTKQEKGLQVWSGSISGVLKKGTGGASTLANGIPFMPIDDWQDVPCTFVLDTGCTLAGTFDFNTANLGLAVNSVGGLSVFFQSTGDVTVTWDTTS